MSEIRICGYRPLSGEIKIQGSKNGALPILAASILQKGDTAVTPQQVRAFVLNIKYDGTTLMLVTGTSFHTFLMDKTPDTLWDNAVRQFLSKQDISYEEM